MNKFPLSKHEILYLTNTNSWNSQYKLKFKITTSFFFGNTVFHISSVKINNDVTLSIYFIAFGWEWIMRQYTHTHLEATNDKLISGQYMIKY